MAARMMSVLSFVREFFVPRAEHRSGTPPSPPRVFMRPAHRVPPDRREQAERLERLRVRAGADLSRWG